MRDYVREFPHLNHLIGGYFHQDWRTEAETTDDAVRLFCRMERSESVRGLIVDIEQILKVTETETQLAEALHVFGCAYRVQGSIREWLAHVGSVAREETRRDKALQ